MLIVDLGALPSPRCSTEQVRGVVELHYNDMMIFAGKQAKQKATRYSHQKPKNTFSRMVTDKPSVRTDACRLCEFLCQRPIGQRGRQPIWRIRSRVDFRQLLSYTAVHFLIYLAKLLYRFTERDLLPSFSIQHKTSIDFLIPTTLPWQHHNTHQANIQQTRPE